jgi:hypothetical protein
MDFSTTFRKPAYVLLTLGLGLLFTGLYLFFDFREGGLTTTLWTTHLTGVAFYMTRFGIPYLTGLLVMDLVIAFLSAALVAIAVDRYRTHRASVAGPACSAGAAAFVGLCTFGCPTCVMPIAGTFGALTMTKVLPFLGLEFKAATLAIIATLFLLYMRNWSRLSPSAPLA